MEDDPIDVQYLFTLFYVSAGVNMQERPGRMPTGLQQWIKTESGQKGLWAVLGKELFTVYSMHPGIAWDLQWSMWSHGSIQFSCSVMSDSLRPHESSMPGPSCPSPTPRVHPNPCPLSWWCHPAISSSVVPFSSCPQSLQHQSLFQWVNSSHEVAKVLEFQL